LPAYNEEKGDRHYLCEAPEGPFRQMVPVPFSGPVPFSVRNLFARLLKVAIGVNRIRTFCHE